MAGALGFDYQLGAARDRNVSLTPKPFRATDEMPCLRPSTDCLAVKKTLVLLETEGDRSMHAPLRWGCSGRYSTASLIHAITCAILLSRCQKKLALSAIAREEGDGPAHTEALCVHSQLWCATACKIILSVTVLSMIADIKWK
eukprot:6487939-Amphidinium_carterae.1